MVATNNGDGVQINTTTEGDNYSFPKKGNKVGVHLAGFVQESGVEFDNTRIEGEEESAPRELVFGDPETLPGLNAALRGMSLGQQATITIPPALAFGDIGTDQVPGGSTVRYEVELVTINGRRAPITAQELDNYQVKCNEWAGKKMEEFDANPEVAAKKSKKYEGREGYKDFLDGEVAKKMQAYEGAREFATLFAEGGVIDKDELMVYCRDRFQADIERPPDA